MKRIRRWTWILRVVQRVLARDISLSEAWSFVEARLNNCDTQYTLRGITFKNPDSLLWKQTLNIFFRMEYNPRGFQIEPDDIVVDIGSNRGVFTAFAASHSRRKVIAFEPDGANFEILKSFVLFNQLAHVQLVNQAVSSFNGHIRLYKSSSNTRHTVLKKDVLTGESLENFVTVATISLDDVLQDLPTVDFLKVDCEGSEFNIFSSISEVSVRKIQKIVMEYHAEANSKNVQFLVDFLRVSGFHVKLDPRRKTLGMIYAKRA